MARPATAATRLLSGEREPVRLCATANVDLLTGGLIEVDGVQSETGDRILIGTEQDDATEVGIYAAAAGRWYRTSDADSSRTLQKGTSVYVQQGDVNEGKLFQFQTFRPNLGEDDIVVTELNFAAFQPLDEDLTLIAQQGTQAYGRSFLTLANAAAGLTLLGFASTAATLSSYLTADLNSDTHQRITFDPDGRGALDVGVRDHSRFVMGATLNEEAGSVLFIPVVVPDLSADAGFDDSVARQRIGMYLVGYQEQPSTLADHDLSMIQARAYISNSNSNGRAFGIVSEAVAQDGGADGVLRAYEGGVVTGSTSTIQKDIDGAKNTIGVHMVGSGDIAPTAAFAAVGNWYKVLASKQSYIANDSDARFIELEGLFEVDRSGNVLVGKGASNIAVAGTELAASGGLTISAGSTVGITYARLGTPTEAIDLAHQLFYGYSDTGAARNYAQLMVRERIITNGSEMGEFCFDTIDAGVEDVRQFSISNGVIVGNPTGGYKGFGTANLDGTLYFDNVALPHALLTATTASFTTAMATKLGHISVTQAVDLDEIEARVNALDAAVILKGSWSAAGGSFPGSGTAQAGESWIVSTGGTVDGTTFNANDRIIAITDNASTSTFANNWFKADYTDQVLTVAGKTGTVTLQVADITDMSANGRSLVSAANYAAMRTLLTLVVGTNVAAWDADLDALAALNSTGIAVRSASNTWVQRSVASGTGISVSNGDGVSGNPTVSLSHLGFQSLTDPNVDRIPFWDDSAGTFAWLTPSGLTITGTSLTVDAATTSAAGISELATTAEARARSSTTLVLTPGSLTSIAVKAHKNGTDQTNIGAGADVLITFGQENYDTDGWFTSSEFTPQVPGRYLCICHAIVGANSGSGGFDAILVAKKNGTNIPSGAAESKIGATNRADLMGACIVDFNGTTDKLGWYAYGTVSLDIKGDVSMTNCEYIFLGN